MIKLVFYIQLMLLIFSFGCKEADVQPKKYPFFVTDPVSEISSTGATYKAQIIDNGDFKITDFGFIWTDGKVKYQYSLQTSGKTDNFKTRISTDLNKGVTYTCRAYIKTIKYFVLGNNVIFTSLGCESLL